MTLKEVMVKGVSRKLFVNGLKRGLMLMSKGVQTNGYSRNLERTLKQRAVRSLPGELTK